MKLGECMKMDGLKSIFAACVCMALTQGPLWADGVTRSVEPIAGGCEVTLTWELSGKVESALIIEERLPDGWTVKDSSVPFASLDASWFSGRIVRLAVKPSLLAQPGSVKLTVLCGEESASGTVAGDWKMYLAGALRKASVGGDAVLSPQVVASTQSEAPGSVGNSAVVASNPVRTSVSIVEFKMVSDGARLSYAGVSEAGTLVVEGCRGLGKTWQELKRLSVSAGSGTVVLTTEELEGCSFMRMKLLTEGK